MILLYSGYINRFWFDPSQSTVLSLGISIIDCVTYFGFLITNAIQNLTYYFSTPIRKNHTKRSITHYLTISINIQGYVFPLLSSIRLFNLNLLLHHHQITYISLGERRVSLYHIHNIFHTICACYLLILNLLSYSVII